MHLKILIEVVLYKGSFFVSLYIIELTFFYFEIILDWQNVAKIIQRGPVLIELYHK